MDVVKQSEKKLKFEIRWTFPCPLHVNNDLLIEAAFSKMKNNLRFMDKSVQKDPELLVTKVEKNTRRFLDLFWLEEGKGREEPGEKEKARR